CSTRGDGAAALARRTGPAAPRCRWADQPGDRATFALEPGHRQEVRAAHPREARRVGSHAGGGGRGAPRPLRVSGPVARLVGVGRLAAAASMALLFGTSVA